MTNGPFVENGLARRWVVETSLKLGIQNAYLSGQTGAIAPTPPQSSG
ncbi:hypothetical protein [Thermoleptolyngbya sp. C42_A2020_037]|nr:hypothetical protein [Thermoleptolyngbya sp. C42_A2020_037]MBF2086241.1 hypothetical protein [Thermoleptolyngbya sp. C42_A2020_037]